MKEAPVNIDHYRLARFREEIQALYDAERKSRLTATFDGKEPFDAMQLTAEDMEAWEALNRGFMDRRAFASYKERVEAAEHRPNERFDERSSRLRFVGFLADHLSGRWLGGEARARRGEARPIVPRKVLPPLSERERKRLVAQVAEPMRLRRSQRRGQRKP